MSHFSLKSGLTLSAATSLSFASLTAQAEDRIYQLEEFVVSAGPVARPIEDFAIPTTALDATALQRSNGSTLGALLDGQPGVAATGFGAGASRPIIRGFDGPRVRILDSGIEALDVSDTSPDHAVSVEPLLVERVEILRGPSTLLYGSSAIGGVVNVVGREIPRTPVDPDGYEGALQSSYDTVSAGTKALGYTTVGGEQWALSVTGLTRESEDYKIPGDAELDPEPDEPSSSRLDNSFVETDAYSVGGSWFFGTGNYLGLAFSRFESLYGIPGHAHAHDEEEEEDHEEEEAPVSIDLERTRYNAELMLLEPIDWIAAGRVRLGYTDYTHTELEGAETGTVFKKEGWELRGEIAHRQLLLFDEGIIGIQISDTDFSAKGEEAFTPPATTRNQAVFTSQHIHGDRLHWDFGARLERQSVNPSAGIGSDYSDLALSLAASAIWEISEVQQMSLSLQRSQRHPSSTELYADGPHLATEQYEIGDPDLELETAYGVDLSYRYQSGDWEGTLAVFYTYFEDYIFAQETGAELDELPAYQFTAVDAEFWGAEAELEYTAYRSGNTTLSYRLLADYVRASNQDSGDNLPRIPPLRIGGGVRLHSGAWDAGVLLRRSFNQGTTAPGESETRGYTELSLDVARSFAVGGKGELTFFAKADNLLDEDIRYHTSFLKEVAPLPGRTLTLGVRYEF